MENKLQPLTENNLPMEKTLCIFRTKLKNIFILGYIDSDLSGHPIIKNYGDLCLFKIDFFCEYQYVLNSGGDLFLYT